MKNISLILLLLCNALCTYAQDGQVNDYARKKEILLNATPLITQFVPFNLSAPDLSRNGIRCKWYGTKYALRTNLNLSANDLEINDIYIAIGYERRRPLFKKFTYTTGWDFFTWSRPGDNSLGRNTITSVGPAKFYGIEYNLSNKLFIATEAQVMIGFGNGFQFRTNMPTSIMFGVRI